MKQDRPDAPADAVQVPEGLSRPDRVRGSLYGGAVGDALGYPVEYLGEKEIARQFGEGGIRALAMHPSKGLALISSDTQMTLFTAVGILTGDTKLAIRGIAEPPREYVARAYQDWLLTQSTTMQRVNRHQRGTDQGGYSWLLDVPELYAQRAPGNTCMSAISYFEPADDYILAHVSDSKGPGGLSRVAPAALRLRPGKTYSRGRRDLDYEGAQLAAITHGHPLGYMPAAMLTHILEEILSAGRGEADLKEIILGAQRAIDKLFPAGPYIRRLDETVTRAVTYSENDRSDLENIHALGEGWVAEEALAIALYCALRHRHDFSGAIIAAVNHRGGSDATGSVTGQIMGALTGYDAIPEMWKHGVELGDVVLEMADDLYRGCPVDEHGECTDPVWARKYIEMHRRTDR